MLHHGRAARTSSRLLRPEDRGEEEEGGEEEEEEEEGAEEAEEEKVQHLGAVASRPAGSSRFGVDLWQGKKPFHPSFAALGMIQLASSGARLTMT